MTDTPIIDTIVDAARKSRSWTCLALEIPAAVWDDPACLRDIVVTALRAANPWEPPAEEIETMARAICVARAIAPDTLHQIYADEYPADEIRAGYMSVEMRFYRGWRKMAPVALAAYRVRPIMRELYPEKF